MEFFLELLDLRFEHAFGFRPPDLVGPEFPFGLNLDLTLVCCELDFQLTLG